MKDLLIGYYRISNVEQCVIYVMMLNRTLHRAHLLFVFSLIFQEDCYLLVLLFEQTTMRSVIVIVNKFE